MILKVRLNLRTPKPNADRKTPEIRKLAKSREHMPLTKAVPNWSRCV